MKNRQILNKILVFILVTLCCFLVSCGVYQPSQQQPSGDGGGGSGADGDSVDDGKFAVKLVTENGESFSPPIEMYAQWTGSDGIYDAKFDDSGYASIDKLDGDYHVTLSAVPDGYTYDPNGYVASNDRKNVEVVMLRIISTTGRGAELYQSIVIRSLGTYRTTLNSKSHVVYYEYEPQMQGKYSIESWVDVTQNEINPIADVYNGTKQFKILNRVQNDGGSSSSYTKNFRMELQLTASERGNVWTFGVHVDCRSGVYPVTVDFTIKYEGEYDDEDVTYESPVAYGPFQTSQPGGRFRYIYGSDRVLRGDIVGLNEEDGFYHLYNNSTGKYDGPTLYAKISQDSEVIIAEGGINWGFKWHAQNGGKINLLIDGKKYYDFIDSYIAHCNSDGVHPVTQELRDFFMAYSCREPLFMDGNGWAETGASLRSSEENQWLFCSGYYA